ncbi:sensor histidine kinase KdpD [Eggerthella sp. YY7918]|uniref:sensor histidine kinase n=1 Tax=Eggerthella sp. (strain YY7918) TaxID=502558 RepID=UPI0002D754CD|nr:HAMP domain-containing sensor histidine kinase [Eggerthella sp. YY7918]
MPRSLESEQARALRRRLFTRLATKLAVFTVAFGCLMFLVEMFVVSDLANWIADNTSEWIYLTVDEYNQLHQEILSSDGSIAESAWDFWPVEDGMFAARDLTIYQAIRSLKIPLAIAIYLLGCIAIMFTELNRSLKHFDTLSAAVTKLLSDTHTTVKLPDELGIIRAELMEIRERTLSDERAAVAAERRKNELVAYLAHDIKTPLTSVLGYLSLLRETSDLPRAARQEYADIAYAKAERLEGLVDEFFEITRYNLQAIPIERERVDIALFCRQVADEFFPDADERGVTLKVEAPSDETFFVDPDKLARALGNVVRNAVAFAHAHSEVRLEASMMGEHVRIAVTDCGREISPAHLQSIFEKFFREDAARSTHRGGAGLGLAIAREIVTAHGGTIAATSEAGVTTFTIEIPRDASERCLARVSSHDAAP